MKVSIPDDALFIRFRPTDADRVLASAEKEHRRAGRYRLSTFAAAPKKDEDTQSVINRLLEAAELDNMTTDKHPKYYLCTSARQLIDSGFEFHKYDDDDPDPGDELAEHYSIDLGEQPTVEDVARFLEAFGQAVRRQP